jgi:hypothetical protein
VSAVEVFLGKGPGRFTLLNTDGQETTVILGSIRYLVQKGFNLSAGDSVEVKAFVANENSKPKQVVAIEVKNLTQKKSLRLRDEKLRPLWRGRNF